VSKRAHCPKNLEQLGRKKVECSGWAPFNAKKKKKKHEKGATMTEKLPSTTNEKRKGNLGLFLPKKRASKK